MFDFLNMLDNYESRKVDRFEGLNIIVDTCYVTDGSQPYETAVSHPDYNDGDLIIVEAYDDFESAHIGHSKWVDIMTLNPPEYLEDCCNAGIGQLFRDAGGVIKFERNRK